MTENIKVFTQSSIRIQCSQGAVYFDPLGIKEELHDAAYIFVTHDHYDHFSPDDIVRICSDNTILIVPEKMENQAREAALPVKEIRTVKPGEAQEINGLLFETVPSYNEKKAFHPKNAGWTGYILRTDGQRIYVAGDTDATREARKVKCDIALVPIGGTYTMDAEEAADLINDISPAIAIPTHYGSIVGKRSDEEVFARNVKAPIKVEFKLQF